MPVKGSGAQLFLIYRLSWFWASRYIRRECLPASYVKFAFSLRFRPQTCIQEGSLAAPCRPPSEHLCHYSLMLPVHKLRIIANIVAFGGPHVNEVIDTGRDSACLGLVGAYACELLRLNALDHDGLRVSWAPRILCHRNRPNHLLNLDRAIALTSHIHIKKTLDLPKDRFTLSGRVDKLMATIQGYSYQQSFVITRLYF